MQNPIPFPGSGHYPSPEDKKPGLYPLKDIRVCRHPEHQFPGHFCIPYGHGYRHVCPACGQVTEVENRGPTF